MIESPEFTFGLACILSTQMLEMRLAVRRLAKRTDAVENKLDTYTPRLPLKAIAGLFLFAVVLGASGCHRLSIAEETAIKTTGSAVGQIFGVPQPIAYGALSAILYAIGHLTGHALGKRKGIKLAAKAV